jgi:hypothetical protein
MLRYLPLLALFSGGCLIPDSLILKIIDKDLDGELALGYIGDLGEGTDCDDEDPEVGLKAPETCGDQTDNDCDGQIDEDSPTAPVWFYDADGDSYGNPTRTKVACLQPAEHVDNPSDCDDQQNLAHPAATEQCNGFDDDCDGEVDEAGDPVTWYEDWDGDGHGNPTRFQVQCTRPPGFVQNATDCDDDSPTAYPGAPDPWYDGLDADCSGGDDFDQDADGARHPSAWPGTPPWDAIVDCDDTNPRIFPNAPELWYDGVDQDCDPLTEWDADLDGITANGAPIGAANDCDDTQRAIGSPTLWFPDADGDTFGDAHNGTLSCAVLVGHVTTPGDCDDHNPLVHPERPEQCDGFDNDCNGLLDDNTGPSYWPDNDNDTFGDASSPPQRSCVPLAGHVPQAGDCDDDEPNIHPHAREVCDGIDNNCAGGVDDGVQVNFYPDLDGDGNGRANSPADIVPACADDPPEGYVRVPDDRTDPRDDCDDTDPRQSYLHDEALYGSLAAALAAGEPTDYVWLCDGLDNDCVPATPADPMDGCGVDRDDGGARFDYQGRRYMMPNDDLATAQGAQDWCEARGYRLWRVHYDEGLYGAVISGGHLGLSVGTRIHVGARTQCPRTSPNEACRLEFLPGSSGPTLVCDPPPYEQFHWYDPSDQSCIPAHADLGLGPQAHWPDRRAIHFIVGVLPNGTNHLQVALPTAEALILCEREIP